MSGMQNFVRGNRDARAASPQNRPSSRTQRQIIGANAKVPMKAHIARPPTGQAPSVHGESVALHQPSSFQQQHVQQRPSGPGQRDFWDTDTGSIDSTANQSVVRVKDEPKVNQQQTQLDHEQRDADDDREARSEEEPEEYEQDEWPDHVVEYLADHDLADASYEDQEAYLKRTQPQLFGTIDGDSYPTTTDGEPTIRNEQHEQHLEDTGPPSPSPKRPFQEGFDRSSARPSSAWQQQISPSFQFNYNAAAPTGSKIWLHSAQIREKQRTDGAFQARGQPDQSHNAALLPTSLPVPHIVAPALSTKHASTIRAKVVPVIQPRVDSGPSEEPVVLPSVDYDSQLLFKMNYDQLKDESFDTDPRAPTSVLPEDVRSKPLPERLEFAQQLDPGHQSEFFSALSTNEWEDAGDWFLDQFSAIIKKTKAARRKKRVAAQLFEGQIEERHERVMKKRRLVDDAMIKMQAQGEGLVPKSPRPSKSPRPRKV